MAHKVFITSTRRDAKLAKKLARDLKKAGAEPVLPEVSIQPGDRIDVGLGDKMRQSDAVLVVLSEDSAKSASLGFEVGAALALGKKVILVTDDVAQKDLPPPLRSIQRVNSRQLARYWGRLAKDLCEEELAEQTA